jgi:quercetin dioxygenase-like cupin family protein
MKAVRSNAIKGKKDVHPAVHATAGATTMRKLPDVVKTSWETLEVEQVTDELARQVIHGEKATVTRLTFKAASKIGRHHHVSEEYCWILSGGLEYELDDRKIAVRTGEIIVVPSEMPHAIVALEDTTCIYFFAPMREDWLKGEDSYLRTPHH